jgi:hypothetical protein
MGRICRNGVALAALAAVLCMGACASKQTTTGATAINAKCPYSGQAVNTSAPTRDYHGQTVGFCCDQCPQTWDKASETDRTAMYDKMAMGK